MPRLDAAIIGAGASGLMAAQAVSRARPLRVCLLEKESRAGRKLLATGNGRCNLLNRRAEPSRYHGGGAETAAALIGRYPPNEIEARFAAMGLCVREEGEGRVYPLCGQASAVLDVLRAACARQGAETRCDFPVRAIRPERDGFAVESASGETVRARRVILAAGGCASPAYGADGGGFALLRALGHAIVPPRPALSPLAVDASRVRGLKGVRAPAALTLLSDGETVQTERGEVLFTEYGLSGIAAMQLSRCAGASLEAGRRTEVSLSLLPECADGALRDLLDARARLFAGAAAEDFFIGLLHRRVGLCLLREAGVSPASPVDARTAERLFAPLRAWRLPVERVMPFAQAQITAGGARMREFDPETLESRLVPGLYACGEALDVDADCGGYNLLWAWASALCAAEACAKSLV